MEQNAKAPQKAICPICPRGCALAENERGFCKARVARQGSVQSESYGKITALALDPIEKKPLARFHPGNMVLSVGSYGCNMRCPFCQNHDIAQNSEACKTAQATTPQKLVQQALQLQNQGNIGIAFTYNEPLVGCEFVADTARLAKENGLATVLVTNGYANASPWEDMLQHIDALNIDLKCFTAVGYRQLGGRLETVKNNIVRASRQAHLEVTTLIVPGLSDSPAEMDEQAAWLASLSPRIPLHISRYFPRWQATGGPTPVETVRRLAAVAGRHLQFVYTGNL